MAIKDALKLILIVWLGGLASCNKSGSITRYDISDKIDSLLITYKNENSVSDELQFCEVFPGGWDSIAIINPYESFDHLDKFNLANVGNLDGSISPEYSEDFCVLLFIKAGSITGYSKVKRMPLDFSTLTPDGGRKFLIGRGDCMAMYLKSVSKSRGSYQIHIRGKS